jgi:ATP-binding cassette subfamily B protein
MKTQSTSALTTLKKVFRYLKHYRLLFALSLILAVVVVVLTLYLPVLFGEAVDLLIGPDQVDLVALRPLVIRAVIVIGITAAATWLMNICNNHITFGMVRRLRYDAFVHIQSLPLSYLDRHPVGDIVSRIVSDAEQVTDGLLMGFSQLFTGVLTILGTLVFMLTINVPMTILTVVITPLSLFVASFIAKRTHSLFRQQSETRAKQPGAYMLFHRK